jgi:hypothetical protein
MSAESIRLDARRRGRRAVAPEGAHDALEHHARERAVGAVGSPSRPPRGRSTRAPAPCRRPDLRGEQRRRPAWHDARLSRRGAKTSSSSTPPRVGGEVVEREVGARGGLGRDAAASAEGSARLRRGSTPGAARPQVGARWSCGLSLSPSSLTLRSRWTASCETRARGRWTRARWAAPSSVKHHPREAEVAVEPGVPEGPAVDLDAELEAPLAAYAARGLSRRWGESVCAPTAAKRRTRGPRRRNAMTVPGRRGEVTPAG